MLPPPPLHPTLQGPRGWRKFFAVSGIVGGFLIVRDSPVGQRWAPTDVGSPVNKGNPTCPSPGVSASSCCAQRSSSLRSPSGLPPAGTAKALSGIVPQPKASIQPGLPEFTSTPGQDGWTTYEVSAPGGFTIELPEGWQPGTDGTAMPSETVFVATLFDTNGGAMMAVSKFPPADATEDPLETAERVADHVEGESDTLGRAEVSQVNLPVGQCFRGLELERGRRRTRNPNGHIRHEPRGVWVPVRLRAPLG